MAAPNARELGHARVPSLVMHARMLHPGIAGYLSVKPCGRSNVVDAWPVKDTTGRQWWFLGPEGNATVPDLSGKPANIRVCTGSTCGAACMHVAAAAGSHAPGTPDLGMLCTRPLGPAAAALLPSAPPHPCQ